MLNRNYGSNRSRDPTFIIPYFIDESGWPASFAQQPEGITTSMHRGVEPSSYSESIGLWVLLPYFALIFLAFMIHYIMVRPCRDCKNIRLCTGNSAAFCSKHAVANQRMEILKKNRATPYSMENRELPARSSPELPDNTGMLQSILQQIIPNPPVPTPIPSDIMGRKFSLTVDSAAWIRRYNEDSPADQPERDKMELQSISGNELPEPRPPTVNTTFHCVPPSMHLQRSDSFVPLGNASVVPQSVRTQQADDLNANLEMARMDADSSVSNDKVLEIGVPDVRNVLTEVVTKLNEGMHECQKKKICASQEINLNVSSEKECEIADAVDTSDVSIIWSSYDEEPQAGMTGVRKRTANNSRLGSNVTVSPALSVDEDAEGLNRRLGSHEPLLESFTDLVKHTMIEPRGIDDNRTKQDIERLSGSLLEGGVRQLIEGSLAFQGEMSLQNTPAKTGYFNKYSPSSIFIPIDMEFSDSPIEAAHNIIATASNTSFQKPTSSPTPQSKASMDSDGALDNYPQPSISGRSNSSMATLCRPPCGLVNVHGASCYVNAGLQLLATVPQFEEAVLQGLRIVPAPEAPAATLFVQFLEDRRHENEISPAGILHYLFKKHFTKFISGVQADSEEFVYTLLLDIHEELFMTPSNPVEELFRGQQVMETTVRGGHHTVKSSMFQTLVLHVLRHCTLENCLDHYTAEHWDESFSTKTRVLLSRLPPLLLLRLQSYDSSGCKTYNKINLGDTINIRTEWMTPELAKSSVDPRYRMRSVIFHTGLDTDSGHYTAAVCQTPSPEVVVWYYCDDSKVTQTDFVTIENTYRMNHPQLVLLERIASDN